MKDLSDLDLLVEREIAAVDAFGYGSYRCENQEQARKFKERLDALKDEAKRRGLMDEQGMLTERGRALQHDRDPRVAAKQRDNQSYFHARFGGGARHSSPYGESYGR